MGSNERGDRFLEFARKLIPLTETGRRFPVPKESPRKTHDQGIDLLTAETEAGERLFVQSKFRIKGKDEFDSIISKFQNYESSLNPKARQLLFDEDEHGIKPIFMVITSSSLGTIRQRYCKSMLASREFHDRLHGEDRIVVMDGERILTLLQQL